MKDFFLITFILLSLTNCAHRGLELSEQMPQKLIEKARANTPNGYKLLGVIKRNQSMSEQNIVFSSPEAREHYQNYNAQKFYHTLVDSAGKTRSINPELKSQQKSRAFTSTSNPSSPIELEEFSYTQAYQDKFGNSAVVIESESNQQFNFINEGMLAH